MNKLLYFGAEGTPLSTAYKKPIQELCNKLNIEYNYIDAKQEKELVRQYKVYGVPFCVLLKNDAVLVKGRPDTMLRAITDMI